MKHKWRILALGATGIVFAFGGVVAYTGSQCCHSPADGEAAAVADRTPSHNKAAVAAGPERISVHSVPLRCPLVTGLGCGSESKPLMKKLEANSAVEGAWINHRGTCLAVLWRQGTEPSQRSAAVASAFVGHGGPQELAGDAREVALSDFLSGVAWYRTNAVDELSRQEADVVSTRWVERISGIIPLPKKLRDGLQCRLSDQMRRRFVEE